jgi:hypothetical protein
VRDPLAVAALEGADPVGACVGMRGADSGHCQELNNEKTMSLVNPIPSCSLPKPRSGSCQQRFLDDDLMKGAGASW